MATSLYSGKSQTHVQQHETYAIPGKLDGDTGLTDVIGPGVELEQLDLWRSQLCCSVVFLDVEPF